MKKLFFLFVATAALCSCSSDNDTPATDLVLQKVVFYRNSANERQWNISDGLLKTITLADGTIVEKFTYDNFKRVIKDEKYTNGVVSKTNTITYNDDDTIKTIDGLPYFYNAATKTYTYSYGSNFTINCEVNAAMLAVNFIRGGVGASEYHMTYTNGDMTSFRKVNNGTADTVKNFHFDAAFGFNPMRDALMPVARVKSLTDPEFFVDCQTSKNLANGYDGGSNVPYHFNYGIIPSNKLTEIGIEVLDSNNNFVEFYSFADYHYQ